MNEQTPKLQNEKLDPESAQPYKLSGDAPNKYLFYNTMPKIKQTANNQMVQPTIQVIENMAGNLPKQNVFQKHKIFLIILGIIIIASPVIYYFLNKHLDNLYKQEDLIVVQIPQTKTDEKTATNTAENLAITTPKEWQKKYFNAETCENLTTCGDEGDPDRDGLTNLEEYKLETDPNNNDSDQDGLSDGDEANIFNTNPLKTHTAGNPKYSDADFLRGGYDIQTDKKLTEGQIRELTDRMDEFGLHQPTLTTLGDSLIKIYNFGENNNNTSTSTTESLNIDQSLEAKQDRDAQRSNTIKNIGIALLKYQTDNTTFPKTANFKDMYSQIRPYLKVATNPEDPINKEPYIYTYASNAAGTDYTLTFYSEVAMQIIKKRAANAEQDKIIEEANIFDDQRKYDLQNLRSALLLYSANNIAGNQDYVFPSVSKYKTDLVPTYLTVVPKDPKTQTDYEYQVNETFDTFTLKAILDNPSSGTTGYLCNQEECRNY